jgi:hypothetical protein
MAFSEALPRNSESRAIAIAMRLLRKHAPHLKWVVSFSDGTQCGDGTIYRASGFVLTRIAISKNLVRRADGVVIHKMTLESNPTAPRPELGGRSYYAITGGKYNLDAYAKATSGNTVPGYQLRYLYFLDPAARELLNVPVIPFAQIPDDVRMYKGRKLNASEGEESSRPPSKRKKGGASPTLTLQPDPEV